MDASAGFGGHMITVSFESIDNDVTFFALGVLAILSFLSLYQVLFGLFRFGLFRFRGFSRGRRRWR